MPSHTHLNWACPFYKWDERLRIHCEGGRQCYPDRQAVEDMERMRRAMERMREEEHLGRANEIAPDGAVK